MSLFDNNDEDDFEGYDYDDLSEEEKARIAREKQERQDYIDNHPLSVCANEVLDLVEALFNSMVDRSDEDIYSYILDDAIMLAPKISLAMNSDSWLANVQLASLIRQHAISITDALEGMHHLPLVDKQYVKIIQAEMESFRLLFREWVSTFDMLPYEIYEDKWGVFYRK